MFETLKRLYLTGKLSPAGLQSAVRNGWITAAERENIVNWEEPKWQEQ